MTESSPLVPASAAPLAFASSAAPRRAVGATPARLGRLAACLAALALPVIGIDAAETVHRVASPRTVRAAASAAPIADAAVVPPARAEPRR